MNTKELKELEDALRYALEKCKAVLVSEIVHDSPIDELAVSLACLFELGGNDRPLREWFRALEERTVRELVKNGANGDDIDRYMGISTAARQQYFRRRYGCAITDLKK